MAGGRAESGAVGGGHGGGRVGGQQHAVPARAAQGQAGRGDPDAAPVLAGEQLHGVTGQCRVDGLLNRFAGPDQVQVAGGAGGRGADGGQHGGQGGRGGGGGRGEVVDPSRGHEW